MPQVTDSSTFDFNAALDAIELVKEDKLPSHAATPEYAEFTSIEFAERYARLKALMKIHNVDAILATQEENVRYFTGYISVLWVSKFRPFIAILPADEGTPAGLVVPGQEKGNADATSWVADVLAYPPQDPPIPHLAAELERRGLAGGRVGIELGFGQRLGMNQQQLGELGRLMPNLELVDATPLTQTVRMLKSGAEIERLAKASEISEAGVRAGWEAIHEGISERELVGTMAAEMYRLGAEVGTQPSVFGIRSGRRWHLSNASPSEYRLSRGDLVNVDGGATYRGYVCDFMRQAACGAPSLAQRKWLELAVTVNQAAVDSVHPGVPAFAVYEAAVTFLAENGAAEHNRTTIVGHGIGADIHELPWLGQRKVVFSSETKLREGMVLSIEPGIHPPPIDGIPGHFITENVVVVTHSGTRVLTNHLPMELWISD